MEEDKIIYNLINKVKLEGEEFTSQEETWNNLWHDIIQRKRKRAIFNAVRIAAVIIIAVGITFISAGTTKSSYDNSIAVTLPCGSSLDLTPNSSVRYNRIGYIFSRQIKLTGDATFEVSKGRTFSVKTNHGIITVLGTKFNIKQNDSSLYVACYEGSVRVATLQETVVLNKGEQVTCNATGLSVSKIEEEFPEYIEYTDEKLIDVAHQIEKIFGLKIDNIDLCDGLTFTGIISSRNMYEALEILFGSCDLTYTINGNVVHLIQ